MSRRDRSLVRFVRFMVLIVVIIIFLLKSHAHAADVEPWSIETMPNGMERIEINVKGCITKFFTSRKNMDNNDAFDQMLDLAEKRQEQGCK